MAQYISPALISKRKSTQIHHLIDFFNLFPDYREDVREDKQNDSI